MAKKGVEKRGRSLENIRKKTSKRKERKDVKKTAKEEKLAKECLDIADVIVVAIDTNRKVTLINRKGCEVLGWREEEILGKDWVDNFIPERLRKEVGDVFEGLMKGEIEPLKYHQNPVLTKSGEERIIAWHNTTLKDRKGKMMITLSSGEDIMERKKAEEALVKANARLDYLLSSSPAVIYSSETKGDYAATFVSENVKQLTGYDSKEFLEDPKFWIERVHPEDRVKVYAEVPKVLEKGHHGYEYRFRNSKGTYRWVHDEMVLVRDAKGEPLEIIGYWADVTESKQVEELLRQIEEKYRDLIENIIDIIFTTDENGTITYISPAVEALIGYNPSELEGQKFATFMYPDDLQRAFEGFQRLSSGHAITDEFRGITKSGDICWFHHSTQPIMEGDHFVGSRGILIDITERKKSEDALMKSEERFREAQVLGQIGNWEFDLATDKIEWSDETYELYERDKALGPPSVEEEALYYPPEEVARLREFTRLATEKGEEFRYDLTAKLPSGKTAFFNATMRPVRNEEGRIVRLFGTVQDITERKMVEGVLQASEENFHNSLDNSPLGIRIVNKDGETLYANKAILDIYGYESIEEFKATPIRKRYTPESYKQHLVRREKRKKGELVPSDYEISIVRRDGTFRHLQVFRKEVFWGGMKQFQVLYADVTERKRIEERYRTIIRTTLDGFWLVDMQGRFLDVNDAYCNLIGYSREELLTMSIPDIEAVEKPGETVARIRKIMKEGGDRFETRHRCKDGRAVDIEVSVNYMRDEGRMFVFLRDITERKRYQAKLAAILEFSLKMGSTFDIKEIADILLEASEKVLRYRNCALELVDRERQELYAFARRGFPEEAPFFRLPLDSERGLVIACMREGRVIYAPDVRKDERYYEEIETTLSNLCVPLEAGEEVIGVLNMESPRLDEFTEEDISLAQTLASSAAIAIENARLYEQIRQSNLQLEFVTDLMSHDLANINQVALGNIEMLLESELSEKNKKHLVASINAMRRSGRLVKNARILRKMLESEEEKEEIELSTLIERAIQNFKEYPGKNVRIEYEARPVGRILADANLCFALENIVDNAIRFSPATEAKVAVDVIEEKDFFRIEIKDWGKGISDALKEEIFDRFERLKKGVMGTGLGLYATKRIIEKHSGKIGVSDNPEGGSIFCVKLPRL